MKEQLKIFTFVSGHGETLIEPAHEDHINRWLSRTRGRLRRITQSESMRAGVGHHVTVCVWYVPDESAQADAAELADAESA